MPTQRNKPTRTAASHTTNLLATIQDRELPHRRRAAEARFCLRHGIHQAEALQVLRDIAAKPDRSIRGKRAIDMVRRALVRFDTPRPKKVMKLPRSWKGLIGGAPPNVQYIPDADWERLSQKDRFLSELPSHEN